MAKKLGWRDISVIASPRLPEDFGGILLPTDEGKPHRIPDDFVWEAKEMAEKGETVLLFFDEISCSPPAVQSALLTAILDLKFGSVSLPKDKVKIVAAANPADIAAGGFELADSLAARFTHLEDDAPVDEFINWLVGGDGANIEVPTMDMEVWDAEYRKMRGLLAAYLNKFRDHQSESVEQREGREPKRFACRRTWDNGLRLYAAGIASGDEEAAVRLIEAAVGPLGLQFVAWAQEQDVPDPADLLKDPTLFSHDKARPDRTFAVLSAVAGFVTGSNGKADKLWPKAWPVLSRAIDTGASADEVTPAVMVLAERRPKGGLADPKCKEHVIKVASMVKDVQRLAEGFNG